MEINRFIPILYVFEHFYEQFFLKQRLITQNEKTFFRKRESLIKVMDDPFNLSRMLNVFRNCSPIPFAKTPLSQSNGKYNKLKQLIIIFTDHDD